MCAYVCVVYRNSVSVFGCLRVVLGRLWMCPCLSSSVSNTHNLSFLLTCSQHTHTRCQLCLDTRHLGRAWEAYLTMFPVRSGALPTAKAMRVRARSHLLLSLITQAACEHRCPTWAPPSHPRSMSLNLCPQEALEKLAKEAEKK